jgi:CubicO group peptidase (beta-lactamase class C family)
MRNHSRRSQIIRWIGLVMLVAATGVLLLAAPFAVQSQLQPTPTPATYWPTQGWRTSTPEQQGMDSATLVAMLDEIHKQGQAIHGLLVVRNGYMVLEAYSYPFKGESRHWIASATKSFTSALIGIAIDKGSINGINQKLLDFFPDRTVANVDARKRAITLEHVLTMSSGLDWPTRGPQEDLYAQYSQSKDLVQFVLDRPMAYEPGTHFAYNSGGTHLLAAIVQKTTGMTAQDFAWRNLFAPMGISDFHWLSDRNGINWGEGGLALIPRDLAKFGYLYLNNGVWEGQSVVPEAWVKASTAPHIETGDQGYGLSRHYGYQWWVDADGTYKATGSAGQRLFVIPKQAMVVAFVGGASSLDSDIVPETLLTSFILPAVKSATALPANPEQITALESRVRALAMPEPRPVPPLPAMARSISGKAYTVSANSLGIKAFALNFAENQASIKISIGDASQELPVGLDDVYRFTTLSQSGAVLGLKGSWSSQDTFILYLYQDYGSTTEVRLTFKEKGLEALVHIPLGVDETVSGMLQD